MAFESALPWYVSAKARAEAAFAASRHIGDRGAMLREICRLSSGYLDLSIGHHALTPADRNALGRFGLKLVATPAGEAVIIDDTDPGPVSGLTDVLRLDGHPRQIYPTAAADALLIRHSQYGQYRAPTQKAAVRALATMPAGASLLVTLPTGAGKSLLFQLAPGIAGTAGACAVVIVPTVALALAHVDSLRSIPGLEASACIHGGLSGSARQAIYDGFGRGEIPILVLSPEVALASARSLLMEVAQDPATKLPGLNAHLTHFFIDEAHIIESWGRTFRPDFQRLPGLIDPLREANPSLRTVLLSATVNDAARTELRRAYGASDFLSVEAKVARYEFDLVQSRVETAAQRDAMLIELVDRLPRPAIIYTTLVKHAETLHQAICNRGYGRLALFTGQINDGDARLKVVTDWRAGDIDLVVATSAFGMGIDKDDVRAIVHACVPESPSRYYQEIGRAARDGNQALALMLWTDDQGKNGDWRQARKLWSGSWLTAPMVRKRWRAIVKAADQLGGSTIADGIQRLVVPLDAAHEDLASGDTDYNRDWNRSLLNMLQRAGAVQIMATESRGDVPVWHVDILEASLLSADEDDGYWARIADLRADERAAALSDLDQFKSAIFQPETCVTAAVFDLVEAGNPLVPPCGRCAYCRAHSIAPPTIEDVRFEGLDRRWPRPSGTAKIRPGISILHPTVDDGTIAPSLLASLVAAGIEQFVVPDHDADSFATRLVGLDCALGLVNSHSDVLGAWRPAIMPTAYIINDVRRVDRLIDRIEAIASQMPAQTAIVVAPAHTAVRGKPIVNILSNSAPISEASLRNFAKDTLIS
jgi:ATP-dependent DNA helicase RecQ